MMSRFLLTMLVAVTAGMPSGVAFAQTALLDEVHTISSGNTAPIEKSFDITQAGTFQLTMTDLKLPAAMTVAKLAVTSGTTVLGTTATSPTDASAVLNFDAPAGTLVVRIVAKLATNASLGTVGVKITRAADSTTIQEFVTAIEAPAPAIPDNQARLDENLTLTNGGAYEVTLTDLGLPLPLTDLELGVTEEGGGQVLIMPTPGTQTFTAQAGHRYNVLALGEADPAITAGLFSVRIRELSSGTVVLSRTVRLGHVEQLGAVVLSAAPHILTLTDFHFPSALTRTSIALTRDGQLVAQAATSGDAAFTAAAGEHAVYALVQAPASSSGTYAIEVRPQGGAAVFTTARSVGGSPGTTPAFTFVADVATAGAYRVRLADFAFPSAFTSAQLAVAQGGASLGTLTAPGSVNVTAAAGRLFVVLLAEPSTAGGGVIGIDVAPAAGGDSIFEVTQGAGNLFQSRKVSVPGNGTYRVKVKDVGFPASFAELGVVITRGAERLGTVVSGAQGPGAPSTTPQFDFEGTAGNYFVNFTATPDATEAAGTYGIQVAEKPAAPVVTFAAEAAQVNIGATTKLNWTATGAASCAADGWTTLRDSSGSVQVTVNATTTYKLDCTGDGGTTSKSVTVTAVAQSSSKGGGGGRFDPAALACLGLCVALAAARRRPRGVPFNHTL